MGLQVILGISGRRYDTGLAEAGRCCMVQEAHKLFIVEIFGLFFYTFNCHTLPLLCSIKVSTTAEYQVAGTCRCSCINIDSTHHHASRVTKNIHKDDIYSLQCLIAETCK